MINTFYWSSTGYNNNNLGCGCDNAAALVGFNCEGTAIQIGYEIYGGMVFQINEDCTGLIVSLADVESIGTGYQNTLDIVAQNCEALNSGISAAQATSDYTSEGYIDWYLPSKDELKEMYNTIGNGGSQSAIGGFETVNSTYWSSSEYSDNYAWFVYFSTGITNAYGKYLSFRVRAIRAF
tara:strand:+ start:11599 stop:12138 length:540 start_codon:yes stop_codon:yes gene_type:complete